MVSKLPGLCIFKIVLKLIDYYGITLDSKWHNCSAIYHCYEFTSVTEHIFGKDVMECLDQKLCKILMNFSRVKIDRNNDRAWCSD